MQCICRCSAWATPSKAKISLKTHRDTASRFGSRIIIRYAKAFFVSLGFERNLKSKRLRGSAPRLTCFLSLAEEKSLLKKTGFVPRLFHCHAGHRSGIAFLGADSPFVILTLIGGGKDPVTCPYCIVTLYSFQPVYFAVSRISLAFWTRSAVGVCVSFSA